MTRITISISWIGIMIHSLAIQIPCYILLCIFFLNFILLYFRASIFSLSLLYVISTFINAFKVLVCPKFHEKVTVVIQKSFYRVCIFNYISRDNVIEKLSKPTFERDMLRYPLYQRSRHTFFLTMKKISNFVKKKKKTLLTLKYTMI